MYVLCLCIWAWTRQRPEREKAPNAQTGFPPFILFLGTRCLFILPRRSFSRSLAMVRIDHTNFLPLLSITLLKGFSFKKGKSSDLPRLLLRTSSIVIRDRYFYLMWGRGTIITLSQGPVPGVAGCDEEPLFRIVCATTDYYLNSQFVPYARRSRNDINIIILSVILSHRIELRGRT